MLRSTSVLLLFFVVVAVRACGDDCSEADRANALARQTARAAVGLLEVASHKVEDAPALVVVSDSDTKLTELVEQGSKVDLSKFSILGKHKRYYDSTKFDYQPPLFPPVPQGEYSMSSLLEFMNQLEKVDCNQHADNYARKSCHDQQSEALINVEFKAKLLLKQNQRRRRQQRIAKAAQNGKCDVLIEIDEREECGTMQQTPEVLLEVSEQRAELSVKARIHRIKRCARMQNDINRLQCAYSLIAMQEKNQKHSTALSRHLSKIRRRRARARLLHCSSRLTREERETCMLQAFVEVDPNIPPLVSNNQPSSISAYSHVDYNADTPAASTTSTGPTSVLSGIVLPMIALGVVSVLLCVYYLQSK
jgi:hypothetical protein